MSSSVAARGLPPAQTSAIAAAASAGMSSLLAPISLSDPGVPSPVASAVTARTASMRASSIVISSVPATPMAWAMSRNFSPVNSALNRLACGSRIALATPCAAS